MNIEQMNTIVETIVNECESIISETENVTEVVDLESFAEELLEIRTTAEELQTLILNIEESEYISNNMLDSLDNKSIQLYQEIKYSFDNIESLNGWLNLYPEVGTEARKRLKIYRQRKRKRLKESQPELFD